MRKILRVSVDGVAYIVAGFRRVVHLPPRRGENVFVTLVPPPFDDFTRVRLVLLHCRIVDQPDVFVYIEMKQWA